jgi:hypothetical protein
MRAQERTTKTKGRTSAFTYALAATLALTACGGGGSSDQTTGFVGAWTFSSGSLAATCTGIPSPSPFDLTGLGVTFAKVDDTTISLTAGTAGCIVDFGVSGDMATVKPNQKCTLALGKSFGNQTVAVTTWTLTRTGDRIDTAVMGAVLFCTASGTGVLVRGGLDAGTTDADVAGDSGGSDVGGDSGSDAGAAGDAGDDGSDAGASPDAPADSVPSPDLAFDDRVDVPFEPDAGAADVTGESGD